jgi:hypothetical protein
LQAGANSILELLFLPIRIEVQHRDFARGARPQTFQDFDRARLARPVRSQQPEDFTGANLEIDAFDGFEISVRLAKPAHVDGKFGICGHSSWEDD